MQTTNNHGSNQSKIRSLKIQPHYRFNRFNTSIVPELKLCGNWLADLGFKPDHRVKISASNGQLVITVEE